MYASIVIGLAMIGVAYWGWSSERVHEWVWRMYLQGSPLGPDAAYERGVTGTRLAAGFIGGVGGLLILADLVTAAVHVVRTLA